MHIAFSGIVDLEEFRFINRKKIIVEQNFELDICGEIRDQFSRKIEPQEFLKKFIKFGKSYIKNIYGDFSIVVINKKKKCVYFISDRFNAKKIYYCHSNSKIFYSTQFEQIPIKVKKEINYQCIISCFLFHANIYDQTIYKNVFYVPAATIVAIDLFEIKKEKYWNLMFTSNNDWMEDSSKVIEYLKENLSHILKMYAQNNYAVALSGGLDSTILADIMSEVSHSSIHTYSIEFDLEEGNEKSYQEYISKRLGTTHYPVIVTLESIRKNFLNVCSHIDTPFFSLGPIAEYIFISAMSNRGERGFIDGQGADELFGGYSWFVEDYSKSYIDTMNSQLPENEIYFRYREKYNRYAQFYQEFYGNTELVQNYGLYLSKLLCRKPELEIFYNKLEKYINYGSMINQLLMSEVNNNWSKLKKEQVYSIDIGLCNYALSYLGYIMSSANKVDIKHPFLHENILLFACSISDSQKIHILDEKYILKKLAKVRKLDLIAKRKKQPFKVPYKSVDLLQNEELAYLVSSEYLDKTGIFSSACVRRMINSECISNSALIGILSMQGIIYAETKK